MANKRLIDANALLNWLEECTDENDWLVSQYNADWIWSMLDSAPTVDAVEVVHGRWLDGYGVCDNKKSYISIDCSNCGEYFKLPSIDENIEEWKKRFAYCPFCGAKMDGDGNV